MTRLTNFTRQGLRFDVLDQGPENGPVVLLLHGFPQDAHCWDDVAARLNAHGLRTLAVDQRGYSRGARPEKVSDYRREELSADALALADAAGAETFHLVGHDWGGVLAWDIALRAPERVSSLTVLSTPHPTALGHALKTADQLKKSWYIGMFQIPAAPERLLAGRIGALARRQGIDEEAASRYGRRFATAADLRGPINWYRAMFRHDGVTEKHSGNGIITVPTTFVWGNRDPALGRTAAEESEVYVHAPYRFLELDAGHWLPEREAATVADAIVERISSATAS
ncbi:alpha/beta fold hydrolase [Kocuria tytonicola]|uniref:Alpha/beta fold hydrolase n=1 Tax=Kocuria tytonicola TaxID=2055946 RepID=A0A3L9L5Q2_9MICC|nr:alpha/beta fold hydrolase [Kocuria tytonicola]RLY93901.1 alpha/beta fold hydrolase [Kocuria tytonicola]